jgi:hypothetical protein
VNDRAIDQSHAQTLLVLRQLHFAFPENAQAKLMQPRFTQGQFPMQSHVGHLDPARGFA